MDDPSVLTGLSRMVNKRKVNTKLNLDNIERELIGLSGSKAPVKDVESELTEYLRDIKTTPAKLMQPKPLQPVQIPTVSTKIQNFVNHVTPEIEPKVEEEFEPEEEEEEFESVATYKSPSLSAVPNSEVINPYLTLPPVVNNNSYSQIKPSISYGPPLSVHSGASNIPPSYAQEALQVYAGDYNQQQALAEQEDMEDQKEKMIADIEDLRDELTGEGINTNRIPEVNMDSNYEDVTKVHKQLKRKYDRSRCEDLGQGVIMAAANMIEMAFDGQKSYFGYKPDMTGWNRTVRSKMRRLRFEQSVIVSEALEYYNVGPISRMGLELIPSAFLYSLTRRSQHGKDNYTPETGVRPAQDSSAALDDLRQFEN